LGAARDAVVIARAAVRRGKQDQKRIASPEMFPDAEMLPHPICSRPMFIGEAKVPSE